MSIPRVSLWAKLLLNKDQIKNVDGAIAIGIWGGFTESIGNLHQIQDIDSPIAVDSRGIFGLEIHFAVQIGKLVGDAIFPTGNPCCRLRQ